MEIATTIGELKQIEFQDNEANLMFGEDGRELDVRFSAYYLTDVTVLLVYIEGNKGTLLP